MSENIQLDGREFRAVEQDITAAQDDYILVQLRASGALEILGGMGDWKEANVEEKSAALMTAVMDSGRKAKVLGGVLTEVGKKWNRKEADRNAEIFENITDVPQKVQMNHALVGFIVGFFSSGALSRKSSPSSSDQSETESNTKTAEVGT